MEVTTPVLSSAGNPDPNINSLRCGQGYLRTSPEFAMKRMLCAGAPDIFELGPVFRAEERGRFHNPEFTMLEWYRREMSYLELAAEVVELVQSLGWNGPQTRMSFVEAARELTGPAVDVLSPDGGLDRWLQRKGWYDGALTHRIALDLLLARMPGALCPQGVLVLHDFPVQMAALAQVHPDEPRLAQRFEVYVDGVELANGYQELQGGEALRARFDAENQHREKAGLPSVAVDERLLQAQAHGLPQCAGVALGFDRLCMVLQGKSDIAEVMSYTAEVA